MDTSCRHNCSPSTEVPSVIPTDLDDQHKIIFHYFINQAALCACILQKNDTSPNFDTKTVSYFQTQTRTLEMCGLIDSTVYAEYRFNADTCLLN